MLADMGTILILRRRMKTILATAKCRVSRRPKQQAFGAACRRRTIYKLMKRKDVLLA